MSEVILVVLQSPETVPALLRAAERLPSLAHGARVNALAVNASAAAVLRTGYDDWLAAPRATPVPAHWHSVSEHIDDAIEQRGARADLVVIARPVEADDSVARHAFR